MAVSQESLELLRSVPADRVTVLVVGDPNVGKTALVQLLCESDGASSSDAGGIPGAAQRPTNPRGLRKVGPTTGCSVGVKLVEAQGSKKPYFVEFCDVGGAPRYAGVRPIFYSGSGRGSASDDAGTPFHGVLFVHDLTNRRSFENMLDVWIPELVQGYHEATGGMSLRGVGAGRKSWAQQDNLQRRGAWQADAGGGIGEALLPDASGGSSGGKVQWHQALSTCPELPMLVVGTKGELAGIGGGSEADGGSPSKRAKVGKSVNSPRTSHGSLAQDAAQLHPLAVARASAVEGWLEPVGAVEAFLQRVLAQALGVSGGGSQV